MCEVPGERQGAHSQRPARPWHLAAAGYRLQLLTILLAPLQNQDMGGVPHAGAYRCPALPAATRVFQRLPHCNSATPASRCSPLPSHACLKPVPPAPTPSNTQPTLHLPTHLKLGVSHADACRAQLPCVPIRLNRGKALHNGFNLRPSSKRAQDARLWSEGVRTEWCVRSTRYSCLRRAAGVGWKVQVHCCGGAVVVACGPHAHHGWPVGITVKLIVVGGPTIIGLRTNHHQYSFYTNRPTMVGGWYESHCQAMPSSHVAHTTIHGGCVGHMRRGHRLTMTVDAAGGRLFLASMTASCGRRCRRARLPVCLSHLLWCDGWEVCALCPHAAIVTHDSCRLDLAAIWQVHLFAGQTTHPTETTKHEVGWEPGFDAAGVLPSGSCLPCEQLCSCRQARPAVWRNSWKALPAAVCPTIRWSMYPSQLLILVGCCCCWSYAAACCC